MIEGCQHIIIGILIAKFKGARCVKPILNLT